jgi:hypothetical protein
MNKFSDVMIQPKSELTQLLERARTTLDIELLYNKSSNNKGEFAPSRIYYRRLNGDPIHEVECSIKENPEQMSIILTNGLRTALHTLDIEKGTGPGYEIAVENGKRQMQIMQHELVKQYPNLTAQVEGTKMKVSVPGSKCNILFTYSPNQSESIDAKVTDSQGNTFSMLGVYQWDKQDLFRCAALLTHINSLPAGLNTLSPEQEMELRLITINNSGLKSSDGKDIRMTQKGTDLYLQDGQFEMRIRFVPGKLIEPPLIERDHLGNILHPFIRLWWNSDYVYSSTKDFLDAVKENPISITANVPYVTINRLS